MNKKHFQLAYRIKTKWNFIVCAIPLMALLHACSFFERDSKNKIIARVYDKNLFADDLNSIIPKDISSKDSILIVKNYIDSWIRQELILEKAKTNISDQEVYDNIEKQLEDYKNSLIIYAYEQELVRQKLDTLINEKEIEKYYTEHIEDFNLKDNIIKVIYLKIKKEDSKFAKVKQWYKSENARDKTLLEEYCRQYAINYFLDDNTWLLFDDLLKEIPIKTYDKEQFLKNNRYIEIKDSTGIYLVNIKGFKTKEGHSPLGFEKENIKNIILNKRKLTLIDQMEKNLYQEAIKKNDFEIFIK